MGTMGGEASILVPAPIDEVYALLADVESAPEWQSGLKEMRVLDRDAEGRPQQCETLSDAKVRTIKTVLRFRYEPGVAVRWEQIKGDLKALAGAWELRDLGDAGTHVTYRLDVDPGRVLGLLVRGPVEDRMREIMVDARPGELAARLAQ